MHQNPALATKVQVGSARELLLVRRAIESLGRARSPSSPLKGRRHDGRKTGELCSPQGRAVGSTVAMGPLCSPGCRSASFPEPEVSRSHPLRGVQCTGMCVTAGFGVAEETGAQPTYRTAEQAPYCDGFVD
ncbi:hypothetical protein GN956_G17232 [Arapaima gigas]